MTTTLERPQPQVQAVRTSHTLNVPAIRGRMGNTDYYTANFPMGMVVRLFTYDPDRMNQLPVEERSQRALKKSRIPEIARYVGQEDYFFSSLTVSVDAEWLEFVPSELDDNVGVLRLPMETDWIVNDGQHRVGGIAEALIKNPNLRNDNISVLVVADAGLERSQQIFSDLNRTVLKTSKSLDILFDHRSPVNRIATHTSNNVKLFKGKVDKERMSLSANSPYFVTLNGLKQATASLLAHVPAELLESDRDRYTALMVEFWEYATTIIEPWADIASGKLKPAEPRSKYISSYQMMIAAVGAAGGAVLANGGDWKKALAPLKDIDWKKSNPDWQGLVMIGPEIVTRVTTRKALADYLRWKVGVGKQPSLPLQSKAEPPTDGEAVAPKRRGRPPKVKINGEAQAADEPKKDDAA